MSSQIAAPPSRPFNWRKRSDDLFAQASAEPHVLKREALRRKATAALNIAEATEHNEQLTSTKSADPLCK